jgi:hypothetical protein
MVWLEAERSEVGLPARGGVRSTPYFPQKGFDSFSFFKRKGIIVFFFFISKGFRFIPHFLFLFSREKKNLSFSFFLSQKGFDLFLIFFFFFQEKKRIYRFLFFLSQKSFDSFLIFFFFFLKRNSFIFFFFFLSREKGKFISKGIHSFSFFSKGIHLSFSFSFYQEKKANLSQKEFILFLFLFFGVLRTPPLAGSLALLRKASRKTIPSLSFFSLPLHTLIFTLSFYARLEGRAKRGGAPRQGRGAQHTLLSFSL